MLYPKIVLGLCVVEGWLAGVVSGFGSFLYLRLYCANKKRVGTKVESGFSVFFFLEAFRLCFSEGLGWGKKSQSLLL